MKPNRKLLALLGVAIVPFGLVACGDEDENATKTVTVTAPAASGSAEAPADKGEIVKVEMGESGKTYYVKPESTTLKAGTVTFAVTNMGDLYHEFIVYSNADGADAGALPVNDEQEADLVEDDILGEAPYATPPIVPEDKEPGAADHRIRSGGWGAELTVDLEAGKYILLCNLAGHYSTFKQYSEITVE